MVSIRKSLSVNQAIELLNSAVAADDIAMECLIESRVECNKALADHPTIQVAGHGTGTYTVGLLGILNGLFGISETGFGIIAANYEVNCPEGHDQSERKVSVGNKCEDCDNKLILGKLLNFEKMPDEYLKGSE